MTIKLEFSPLLFMINLCSTFPFENVLKHPAKQSCNLRQTMILTQDNTWTHLVSSKSMCGRKWLFVCVYLDNILGKSFVKQVFWISKVAAKEKWIPFIESDKSHRTMFVLIFNKRSSGCIEHRGKLQRKMASCLKVPIINLK